MRKIKKINGFLVVKFNDREKREYEGTALGEYGVIDAEVYTGNLDIDRGAMEYDDADTLEVAVELARGLESEEDITDEPPTYTAAVETNESYTEEAVEPAALIEGWTRRLATQVKSKHYPDTDPRTAAHELYGFKMALHQIGFLPESEVITDPDTFGAGRLDGPMPRNPEELLAFVCDERCKNRAGHTQEELDAICAKCPLGQLYEDAEAQDLRIRERSERALREHIEGVRHAEDTVTALLGGHEALAYSDLSDMEFGEMFSAGISDAVRAFKTSGSGMAQAIQNLGASATTAQVPLEEQLSVLGMLQATMGGAEAGTKYKAFLRSATKGGEALGLKFTDANNQLLSMPEILDILRGKFGETMDAAEKMELQKAFGDTEAVALIDLMYNKVGDLQDNIVNMYGSLGKGVSVTEQMASAIQETEPERFERLKQRIHNVTESIGNSLLPTVNDLMSKGEGVLTKVGSWIEKNQELVKVIMLIVLAVGGFLAVGGTLIALISGVGLVVTKTVSAFKILKGGFALARGALTPLISSVWSFTAALLANPVTWVVIGIVALIAALVLLYNKCEWFRNAVNSVINFFKETLTAVGSVAKSVFEGIGNVIGSVMDAAKATVSEKLSNIKTAYEEHGGGISGVAAAAMEAVKGWYTAGYTFIDNLTGGKLSEIREKFSTAMSNIVQGISQKFTDARTAFSNGLNNIKNAVSGAVTWFFESGKRIVSTFANGIKSAFSSAVEAVKGGLQKIRNLLPFSDAKEGPLSTLTLSGQRTMTTYAHGLTLAGDAPAEAMNKSLQQVQGALDRKPEKKVDLGDGKKDKDESSDEGGSGKGKQVIIHKLLVPVDLKKIKDLQQLLALLQEVEDYAAANEDGEPGDDEDAAPAPA